MSRLRLPGDLRPEHDLLLLCAQPMPSPGQGERIREILAHGVDWPFLFQQIKIHGLATHVFRQVSKLGLELIPEHPAAYLRQITICAATRGLSLTQHLLHVLEVFEKAGIQAVPYKGPVMSAMAYGDVALREFTDIDMILRQRDIPHARELMVRDGYVYGWMHRRPPIKLVPWLTPGQYQFLRDHARIVVELHTERTLRYFPRRLDLDAMLERLQTVMVTQRSVRTFSFADTLILLSTHGTKHYWSRLIWVCDISRMIQLGSEQDWQEALERAGSLGCERSVLLGLSLARDILGASLPPAAEERLAADNTARHLSERLRRRILTERRPALGLLQRASLRLKTRESPVDGLRDAARLAFSPTEDDWAVLHLPRALAPLYWVIRPVRLLQKYGTGLIRGNEPDLAGFSPTPKRVVRRLLELAELAPSDVLYDLGCGDGRIPIAAARRYGIRAVGVDLSAELICAAKANARRQGVNQRVRFLRQDVRTVDLREATVVFVYMSVQGNRVLQARLREQLRPGARILAKDHEMPGWPAEKIETLESSNGPPVHLFLWRAGNLPDPRQAAADEESGSESPPLVRSSAAS